MSSTQGSSDPIRSKTMKAEKGEKMTRRTWSPKEEDFLIAALKELVANNWKSDNGFKQGYLPRLQEAIRKEFPGTDIRGTPHINSKLAIWRRNYGSLQQMLSRSGVGFNGNGKYMIDCEDDQWEQIVKLDANAKGMRYKAWPMYEDWIVIFGKDRATGEHAEDVTDAAHNMEHEELRGEGETQDDCYHPILEEFEADDVGENSVCDIKKRETVNKSSGKGKKRKVVETVGDVAEIISEISRGTHSRLDNIASRLGYEFDLDEAKKDTFKMLKNMEGLSREDKFDVCEIFANKTERLLIFQGLDDEEAKAEYVKRILKSKLK